MTDRTPNVIIIGDQYSLRFPKTVCNKTKKKINDATLERDANNKDTGSIPPSYASGTQWNNGKAPNLNSMAMRINIIPTIMSMLISCEEVISNNLLKTILPVAPYTRDIP